MLDRNFVWRGQHPKADVAVIGAGYVGLPLAMFLATQGKQIVVAEKNHDIADKIRSGVSPIFEPGLNELLVAAIASDRLQVLESAAEAVVGVDFVFLCVGTPESKDGSADMSMLIDVIEEIGPHLAPGAVVVNKSTAPIGSIRTIERLLNRPDVTVVCNPEFLREGSAVEDSFHPDRVVIGADDPQSASRVAALFSSTGSPVVVTDTLTAELIKYASNAFLATKLSFMNSLATLCEAVGADVVDLGLGVGYDSRIGFDFMRPGPGWGGSCLPKDTSALVATSENLGVDLEIVRAAISVNESHMNRIVNKIMTACGGANGRTVGVLGLTFKANTHDRRNSPAIWITQQLSRAGVVVHAFDPSVTKDMTSDDLAHLTIFDDPYSALARTDVMVILTEWQEFRWLDYSRIKEEMYGSAVVDARNSLDPVEIRGLGFSYVGVGR